MLTIQFTYPNGKETYEFPYDTTLEEVLCVPNGLCQKWDDVEFYRKLKGIDGRVNHEYDRLPPAPYCNINDIASELPVVKEMYEV